MAKRREPMTETLRVRVTPTMREQVRTIADAQEVDESDVVRDALEHYIEEHWQPRPKRRSKATTR